jgi:hypothetical protein
MNEHERLEQLAAGINAASRIIKIVNSEISSNSRSNVKPDTVYIIGEVLKTLSEYSSNRSGAGLGGSLSKAASYSDVYRKLKQQYAAAGNKRTDKRMVIDTMRAIHPVLKSNQQLFLDKVIKIHNIIES